MLVYCSTVQAGLLASKYCSALRDTWASFAISTKCCGVCSVSRTHWWCHPICFGEGGVGSSHWLESFSEGEWNTRNWLLTFELLQNNCQKLPGIKFPGRKSCEIAIQNSPVSNSSSLVRVWALLLMLWIFVTRVGIAITKTVWMRFRVAVLVGRLYVDMQCYECWYWSFSCKIIHTTECLQSLSLPFKK